MMAADCDTSEGVAKSIAPAPQIVSGHPYLPAVASLTASICAAAVVLAALRWRLAYYPGIDWDRSIWALKNAFYDIALLAGLAAASGGAMWLARRRQRLVRLIVSINYFACALIIIISCINISAVNLIGGPLTFQWLYYADFMMTFTSQSAVKSALNGTFYSNILGGLGAFAALTILGRFILIRMGATISPAIPVSIVILTFSLVLWVAQDRRQFSGEDRARTASPIIELVRSTATAGTSSLEAETQPIMPERLPVDKHDPARLPGRLADAGIRNVVIIVMESVGAEAVAGFGTKQASEWTPSLSRYQSRSLHFTNIYAHVPYSTKSLFSLLSARYPGFTYKLDTDQFSAVGLPLLSDELHRAGFRTGFFMSGELKFQRVDQFLLRHGFDATVDMTKLHCDGQRYIGSTSDWPNLDAVDDRCTADALSSWIGSGGAQPFLGIMWTGNTHWPYFSLPSAKPHQYAPEERRNRYIGALRASDAAIGNVLDHLDRTGLLASTLVVILGDHGEAFGQHGYRVHGNSTFEEEVHIPLLFINNGIDAAQSTVLGGISDIAPTILDVLAMQPPAEWQGRSLFSPSRHKRVFMFSINQGMTLAYREGDRKYIYQTSRDQLEVFDLRADPHEQRNQAKPSDRETVRRIGAGWLAAQASSNQQLGAR